MFDNLDKILLTAIKQIDLYRSHALDFFNCCVTLIDAVVIANLNNGFDPERKRKAPGRKFSFLFLRMPECPLLANR